MLVDVGMLPVPVHGKEETMTSGIVLDVAAVAEALDEELEIEGVVIVDAGAPPRVVVIDASSLTTWALLAVGVEPLSVMLIDASEGVDALSVVLVDTSVGVDALSVVLIAALVDVDVLSVVLIAALLSIT